MQVSPREVAESYWRAKRLRDVEAMTAHYHVDAQFTPDGRTRDGRAQIHAFHEDMVSQFPGLECTIVDDISDGNAAAIMWEEVLIDRHGVRHPVAGVNIVRVEDGRIRSMRSYVG